MYAHNDRLGGSDHTLCMNGWAMNETKLKVSSRCEQRMKKLLFVSDFSLYQSCEIGDKHGHFLTTDNKRKPK